MHCDVCQVHTGERTACAPEEYDEFYPVNAMAEKMYIEAEEKCVVQHVRRVAASWVHPSSGAVRARLCM